LTRPKSELAYYEINHEGSKQAFRMGMTEGRKNLFIAFQTRKGDIGTEYMTKHEAGEFIEWLIYHHHMMGESA